MSGERPTGIEAFGGRLPTTAEFHRHLGGLFASCVYDVERFCRLVFPLGKEGTPLQNLQDFYPWQLALFDYIARERRQRGYIPGGAKVPAIKGTISSGKGAGKANCVNTVVSTPYGWTTLGKLRVGSRIFDEQGAVCRVTGVFPQGFKRAYRVDFASGESIYADAEHQWVTMDRESRRPRNHPQKLIESGAWAYRSPVLTSEIAETLHAAGHGKLKSGDKMPIRNHAIPVARPLSLPPRTDLAIPPYVLGCWLGDGSSSSVELTALPEDGEHYRGRFASYGEVLGAGRPSHSRAMTHSVSVTSGNPLRGPFRARLSRVGLLGNKHIPAAYLRGSFQQRLELLQGLMDTDGSVEKNGQAYFYQSNEALARQVQELVETLGMKTSLTSKRATFEGRDYGLTWRVAFFPDGLPVATLPRKAKRIKRAANCQPLIRTITNVEDTGVDVEMVCITVDSPSSLYLAGRSLIPTHNTQTMAMIAWYLMATCPWAQGVATSTTGDQLKARLWSHVRGLWEVSPLLQAQFDINSERAWHRQFPNDWKMVALVPSKENPEALQGIHGVWYTFTVGDEGSGIPDQNYTALDGMIGDPCVFQLFSSNPLTRSGVWYNRTFGVDRHEWGHTMPTTKDPLIVDVSTLPNANTVEYDKMRARHGEHSNYFRVNVRGLPPLAETDQLISPETIERQMALPLYTEGGLLLVNPEAPLLCGVDLPGGGADRFVAWFRKDIDARSIPPRVLKGRINSFKTVVRECMRILESEFNGDYVHTMFLDNSNHGSAAYEELVDRGYRRQVIPVDYQGKSPDEAVANVRAFMYRGCNEWLESGGRLPTTRDPYADDLAEELAAQRVDQEARKFQLIKKKLIKEALGRSPDCSDALASTFAERVRPLRRHLRGRRRVRYNSQASALVGKYGWQM